MNEINEPKDFTEEHDIWKEQLHATVEEENPCTYDYYTVQSVVTANTKKGVTKRYLTQFTLDERTKEKWREFITVYTGCPPTRGKGVSSTMAERALLTFMAVMTGLGVEDRAKDLALCLSSRRSIPRLIENLQDLISELEKQQV